MQIIKQKNIKIDKNKVLRANRDKSKVLRTNRDNRNKCNPVINAKNARRIASRLPKTACNVSHRPEK